MPLRYMNEWPRKKAPMFNEIEAGRLITLYCENYDWYHGKFKWGGKNVVSDKQRLLKEWSEEISSLGFATRTKDQIEEKIRNEVKKVQKHLRKIKAEKLKRRCSAGGKQAQVPRLPSYLDPLIELINDRHPEYDVTGVAEQLHTKQGNSSEHDGDYDTSGSLEYNVALFNEDRKPTEEELRELRTKLGLDSSVVLEDPSTCREQGPSLEQNAGNINHSGRSSEERTK
ncbi:unnamed protein product, partial [Strongylus vulgaris]